MKAPLDLKDRRLIICLGPGGVGKTTVSAALALYGATLGRSVDVMTVDPAPRLLDALGLDASSAEPQRCRSTASLIASDLTRGRACARSSSIPRRPSMHWSNRYAPSAAARERSSQSHLPKSLGGAFRRRRLHGDGEAARAASGARPDLIVLDTPPASEAIDFLDAPRRLLELLGSRAITLLGARREPAAGPSMVDFAARAVLSRLRSRDRTALLGDVQGFVGSFSGMYAGFASALQAAALLRSEETITVIVTTAEAARIVQAREFAASLDKPPDCTSMQ